MRVNHRGRKTVTGRGFQGNTSLVCDKVTHFLLHTLMFFVKVHQGKFAVADLAGNQPTCCSNFFFSNLFLNVKCLHEDHSF